jgi:hypothetical protein
MTQIQIRNGRLLVEILGWHKLWCFKSRFDLPLAHVESVEPLEGEKWGGGLRAPGTSLAGVIRAGSYYRAGQWIFWDVCDRTRAFVIVLRDERYAALVMEPFDPEGTLAMLRSHLNSG